MGDMGTNALPRRMSMAWRLASPPTSAWACQTTYCWSTSMFSCCRAFIQAQCSCCTQSCASSWVMTYTSRPLPTPPDPLPTATSCWSRRVQFIVCCWHSQCIWVAPALGGGDPEPAFPLGLVDCPLHPDIGPAEAKVKAFCENFQNFRNKVLCTRGCALPNLKSGAGHAQVTRDHGKLPRQVAQAGYPSGCCLSPPSLLTLLGPAPHWLLDTESLPFLSPSQGGTVQAAGSTCHSLPEPLQTTQSASAQPTAPELEVHGAPRQLW